MAYLTYDEYKSFGFSSIDSESSFDPIETRAESEFDGVTRSFYVENDISADTDANRVATFKKAMAVQCEFIAKSGITSPLDLIDKSIKSVSIGRTTVQKAADYTSIVDKSSGICYTALNLLAQTGLLFKGIDAAWSL